MDEWLSQKKATTAKMQMLHKALETAGSTPAPSTKNSTDKKECDSTRQLYKDRTKGRRMTTDEAGKQMQRLKVTTKNRLTNETNGGKCGLDEEIRMIGRVVAAWTKRQIEVTL